MAIQLEFINVIIPIRSIEKCHDLRGFEDLRREDWRSIGKTVWYDDHLYREGAMNALDIEWILKKWVQRGLELFVDSHEKKEWKDLCVVDSAAGLNIPCNWIHVDLPNGCVWHKGTDQGEMITRDHFIQKEEKYV